MIESNREEYIIKLENKIKELDSSLKKKNQDFTNAQKEINVFLSNLTHNLKNPLGTIYSFSEMILEGQKNFQFGKTEKYLNVIHNSSKFSIKLLNEFVYYSKIISHEFSLERTKVDFVSIIKKVLKKHESILEEKQISIKINVSPVNVYLYLDESIISRAIENTINNAIRYSAEGSEVIVEVFEKKNELILIVEDKGIGISEENLPKIFNEFFVVNTYSENKEKCIGLGLSISKKIIELHNGIIKVESEENKGTKLMISLPISVD